LGTDAGGETGTWRTRLKAASGAFPDAWYRRQRVSLGGREERHIRDARNAHEARVIGRANSGIASRAAACARTGTYRMPSPSTGGALPDSIIRTLRGGSFERAYRHIEDAFEVVLGRRVFGVELSDTVAHGTERLTPVQGVGP
jgi:hypothetical protein